MRFIKFNYDDQGGLIHEKVGNFRWEELQEIMTITEQLMNRALYEEAMADVAAMESSQTAFQTTYPGELVVEEEPQ